MREKVKYVQKDRLWFATIMEPSKMALYLILRLKSKNHSNSKLVLGKSLKLGMKESHNWRKVKKLSLLVHRIMHMEKEEPVMLFRLMLHWISKWNC